MKDHITLISRIGIAILLSLSGCSDKITNVISTEGTHQTNRPPKILLWGPVYDSLAHFKDPLPQPWVIVGDSDGAADIAAVVLNISSIKIVSLIVRPDDSTLAYSFPYYAPYDTINVFPFLRTRTFSVPNLILGQISSDYYAAYLSYSILSGGGIVNDGAVFGPVVKSTRSGYDYLYMVEHFGLYPPALSSPRDVYVTYAEFLVSGISITVYDESGATATVKFPDFYGTFSNFTEDQTPP